MDYRLYKPEPNSVSKPAEDYSNCEICGMEYQFTRLIGVQRRRNGKKHPVCGLCAIVMFGDGEKVAIKELVRML